MLYDLLWDSEACSTVKSLRLSHCRNVDSRFTCTRFCVPQSIIISPSMITTVGRLQAENHRATPPKPSRIQVQQMRGCWLRRHAPRCRNPPGCKLIPPVCDPSIQASGCGSVRNASEACFTTHLHLRVASHAIIMSSTAITTVGRLQAEKHRAAMLKTVSIQPENKHSASAFSFISTCCLFGHVPNARISVIRISVAHAPVTRLLNAGFASSSASCEALRSSDAFALCKRRASGASFVQAGRWPSTRISCIRISCRRQNAQPRRRHNLFKAHNYLCLESDKHRVICTARSSLQKVQGCRHKLQWCRQKAEQRLLSRAAASPL